MDRGLYQVEVQEECLEKCGGGWACGVATGVTAILPRELARGVARRIDVGVAHILDLGVVEWRMSD